MSIVGAVTVRELEEQNLLENLIRNEFCGFACMKIKRATVKKAHFRYFILLKRKSRLLLFVLQSLMNQTYKSSKHIHQLW